MNPLSIKLKNFLCYDTLEGEQPYVFDFRDHKLWSICGDNGAGKSAIFDAITYCLYGEHRGGNSRDEELVHRGAMDMQATFEFEHAGTEFRVTRSIRLGVRPRKGTPTVKRECRMEMLRQDGEWVDVAETTTVRGLEEAVQRILGFGCKTLTASVLLLQGKSDRLIDAGGKERFDILSGILDLSRFERMADKAKDRARQARASYQQLSQLLTEAPPPEQAEVEAAEQAAVEQEQIALGKASVEVEAGKVLAAAKEYWERTERLSKMRAEEVGMAEALKEAPAITAAAKEAELLEATLPRLDQALTAEGQAIQADAAASEANGAAAQMDVQGQADAVASADLAHQNARSAHQQALERISAARAELDGLSAELDAAKDLARFEGQIKTTTAEIAELQTKCGGIDDLRLKVDRLRTLDASKSLIGSYRRARVALAGAQAEAEDGDPEAELQRRRTRREEQEALSKAAAGGEKTAHEGLARRQAKLSEANETLMAREDAGEKGTCTHCGQPVPAQHIKKQIAEAQSAVAAAKRAVTAATTEVEKAVRAREDADRATEAAKEAEAQARACAEAARRAKDEIAEIEAGDDFAALPEDVADLLQRPLAEMQSAIAVLRTEQTQLPQLATELKLMVGAEAAATAKRGLIDGWTRSIGEILDWRDRKQLAEATARGSSLQQEITALTGQEVNLRSDEARAAAALKEATDALNDLQRRKRVLEEQARLKAQEAKGLRDRAKAALTGVSNNFLPATEEGISAARERLTELGGAAVRLEYLRRAESELEGLRGQIKELQRELARTRDGHRVAIELATQALTDAQQQAGEARTLAKSKRSTADELARSRKERLKTQAEADARAMDRAVWDKVGQLLGRGGIQTALMRSALEDIQERANALLNRISGGQLQLAISCEQTSRGEEIELRCVDAASAEEPLPVEFLSGGQRFRCAVALAAGIGQRAGSDGAMPSQIIDEGFGSLDVQGRAEMLDEVCQMSEFYERVIVVSHMESFHDQARFPARFELRKEGTRTAVTVVG